MELKTIHECTKSEIIDKINGKVDQLSQEVPVLELQVENVRKVLEDNGHLGLKSSVIILSENVKNLNTLLEESRTDRKSLHESVEHLVAYKSNLETTFIERDRASSEKEVRKAHVKWLIGIVITLGLGFAALYVDLRKEQKQVTTLQTEIKIEKMK